MNGVAVLTRAHAMKPTRVLLVGPRSGGPLVGGIETGIDMILRSQLAARHELEFFNSFNAPSANRSLPRRVARQLRSWGAFARALIRCRPDVVHVKTAEALNFYQGLGFVILARAAGCRVLMQIHGGAFDSWYERLAPRAQAGVRAALRLPHVMIALSEYWQRYLTGLNPDVAICVVPNGVEMDKVQAPSRRVSERLRVVTIGAIGERKGHFDIVEAAHLVRDLDLEFEFVGPDEYGGETDRIRARVAELGLGDRIVLSGPLGGADKWAALARADVFLLPAYNENMPNAVLEAMAAGLPVIATDVGAVREMLGGSDQIVPVGDPAAIATQLRALSGDAAARARRGRANLDRVTERYSFARVEADLDALYSGR
jgi:glycosyltransferase involved in cell wall biosynthesis